MFKLYIDPGHGGSDPGAVGNGLQEKDLTLSISKRIRDILANEYDDVAVKMARTGDVFPTLQQRTNDANNWGAHYYLSIHINSAASSATGFETFVDTGVGATTQRYQSIIHDEIMKEIGLKDRGKKQARFHVIHASKMPALLTENGFINNSSDAAKMKDDAWLDKVARGHVNGLEKAFNLKKKSSKEETKVTEASVQFEGKKVEALIKDGRTYVQVRELAELLGLKITYDNTSKTTTLSK